MYWPRKFEAVDKLHAAGITPADCYFIKDHERLDILIRLCAPFIRPYVRSGELIFIFPYHRAMQSAPLSGYAGVCMRHHDRICVIGLSTDTLAGKWGSDYVVSVLLHELCHMRFDDHDQNFIAQYNDLTIRFNQTTGRHIKTQCDISAYHNSFTPYGG